MAIPVSDILMRLGHLLHDIEQVRWTEPELIAWINDGAAEVVVRRPSAHIVTESFALAAGALQTLPAGGCQLIDVKRNVSATKKYPIQRADRYQLETMDMGWYDSEAGTYVRNYSYDDRVPTEFYVWPGVAAGVQVEIAYSCPPALVVDNTESVDLPREYIGPMVSYVAYRALSKDFEYNNVNVAMGHYQAFSEALGTNTQTQLSVSPNGGEA